MSETETTPLPHLARATRSGQGIEWWEPSMHRLRVATMEDGVKKLIYRSEGCTFSVDLSPEAAARLAAELA